MMTDTNEIPAAHRAHRISCPFPYGKCICIVERRGDWMQTYTGVQFYPLDPRVEEVNKEDISHALSLLCRYNGHVKYFYSVAQHCVLVSRWVEEQTGDFEQALCGLLHDATEAYMGDMIRPLKRMMPTYREAEDHLMTVIADKFFLPYEMPAIVKEADNRILLDERDALLGTPPAPWVENGLDPLFIKIDPWVPAKAHAEYSAQLEYLLYNGGKK